MGQAVPLDDMPDGVARSLPYNSRALDDHAARVEQQYNLPMGMLRSIKNDGERSNNNQVSPKGASGIMQFMPETAKEYGLSDPRDPVKAIDAAARYIVKAQGVTGSNDPAVLAAAYNGGMNRNILKTGGIPDIPETKAYAARVGQGIGKYGAPASRLVPADDLPDAPNSSGNPGTPAVDQIPTGGYNTIPSTSASAPDGSKDNLLGRAFGKYEVPVAMATGMAGGLIGNIAGVAKSIASGKFGTPEGVQQGQQTATDVSHALTYKPRSETGNYLTQQVGNAIDKSGIMGVPLPALNDLSMGISSASPAAKAVAGAAGNEIKMQAGSVTNKLADMVKPAEKPMIGMGAASTDVNTLRAMRAADLPVPINLTKGQTSRTFEQQRFERETAKLPKEGAPIRQRMEEQNQQMLQNFDAFTDITGAEQPSLRAVGQVVTKAVVDKMAKAKGEINQAYNKAREAGQMTEPVDVGGISDYVNKNRSAAKNAPILDAVESELKRLDPTGTGMLSINDLEELRKMTGRLSQPGTPNSVYGQDVKGLIDASIGDKGGPMYQQARRMYENYSNEFKNTAVIDRMLRNKPGTKDRAVAYEDVFNHSILGGSLDDVRAVRRTLQTAGTEGEQAWKELQGQTVKHIKETITSNVSRDSLGNPIVSPDKLNKLVRNLDADGKLDFVFGKKGAEQIRDINDLAKDVYTSPPGAVNSSNTASVLIGLLDTAVSGVSGVPLPIGTAINYGVKRVKSNALQKRVGEALNQNLLSGSVQRP